MSYKNHKDQKLLAEAYGQVQEAAPVGMGSRFGNWAARKALKYVPFTGNVKSKLEGKKEYSEEVNNLKKELYKFIGKYGVKTITYNVLGNYLQQSGLQGNTVNKLLQTQSTLGLGDKQINEFIRTVVKERGVKFQPQQQYHQPQQQTTKPIIRGAVPDRALEYLPPEHRKAWDSYYINNPQAIPLYKKKFPKSKVVPGKKPATKPAPAPQQQQQQQQSVTQSQIDAANNMY